MTNYEFERLQDEQDAVRRAPEYITPPSHAVVCDMDGTFTLKDEALFALVSRKIMPAGAMKQLQEMHHRFGRRNMAGSLKKREEMLWLAKTMRIFLEAGLTVHDVRRALSGFSLRPGVREFLEWCQANGIPVAIVSYGIRSFIKIALEENNIPFGLLVYTIYAARFDIDLKTGKYLRIDPSSFVLPTNKGECSKHFAKWLQVPDTRILGIGDSGGDRYLGHLRENRYGLARDAAEAAIIAPHFGEVAITDNFYPAFDWVRSKIGSNLP